MKIEFIINNSTVELLSNTDTGDNTLIINGTEIPSSDWTGSGYYTYDGISIQKIADNTGNIYCNKITATSYALNRETPVSGGGHVIENQAASQFTQRDALQFLDAKVSDSNSATQIEVFRELTKAQLDALGNNTDGFYSTTDESEEYITAANLLYSGNKTVKTALDECESATKIVNNSIGTIETTDTAQYLHTVGSYFVNKNGKYCRTTVQINVGSSIVVGTNCVETDISAELSGIGSKYSLHSGNNGYLTYYTNSYVTYNDMRYSYAQVPKNTDIGLIALKLAISSALPSSAGAVKIATLPSAFTLGGEVVANVSNTAGSSTIMFRCDTSGNVTIRNYASASASGSFYQYIPAPLNGY